MDVEHARNENLQSQIANFIEECNSELLKRQEIEKIVDELRTDLDGVCDDLARERAESKALKEENLQFLRSIELLKEMLMVEREKCEAMSLKQSMLTRSPHSENGRSFNSENGPSRNKSLDVSDLVSGTADEAEQNSIVLGTNSY